MGGAEKFKGRAHSAILEKCINDLIFLPMYDNSDHQP